MGNEPIEFTLYLRRLLGCMEENRLSVPVFSSEEVLNLFLAKYPDEYYKGEVTPSTTLSNVKEGLMSLVLLGLVHVESPKEKKNMPIYSLTGQGKEFIRPKRPRR